MWSQSSRPLAVISPIQKNTFGGRIECWCVLWVQNAVEQPPKYLGRWAGAYTINIFVVVWVFVVGFGFGGWASMINFVHQIDTFGLFTKCYQCPPSSPPQHPLNTTSASVSPPPPLHHLHHHWTPLEAMVSTPHLGWNSVQSVGIYSKIYLPPHTLLLYLFVSFEKLFLGRGSESLYCFSERKEKRRM